MLDPKKTKIEGTTLVYASGISGKALLPKAEGKELGKVARAGEYEGKPVKKVVVEFNDATAGKVNADAMKYLGLTARAGGKEITSDANFSSREDFGIE